MQNNYPRITTDETMRETVSHGSAAYPFAYYQEDIWQFDFHCIDWHWHPEVEMVLVEQGTVEMLVGTESYTLHAGESAYIASQMLHRFSADAPTAFPNVVFSPAILGARDSLVYQTYVRPVLESGVSCLVLGADHPVTAQLRALFHGQESGESELITISRLLRIWEALYEAAMASPRQDPAAQYTQAQLQRLLQYLHQNYSQKITLEDLSRVIAMSPNSVMLLFRQHLGVSPIHYLIQYRLRCAAGLLAQTSSSIAAIAQAVGFENTGYFCRQFKMRYGKTPGAYRKSCAGDAARS